MLVAVDVTSADGVHVGNASGGGRPEPVERHGPWSSPRYWWTRPTRDLPDMSGR